MKRKSIRTSRGNVTLSFIPYGEIANLSSVSKIRRILDLCLENRILIIQGRLTPEEETSLIQTTMALVGRVKNFKGVEIAVISGSTRNESVMDRMKENLAKALVGDRGVITLIGPAAIVKEIKKDPKKIELLLK